MFHISVSHCSHRRLMSTLRRRSSDDRQLLYRIFGTASSEPRNCHGRSNGTLKWSLEGFARSGACCKSAAHLIPYLVDLSESESMGSSACMLVVCIAHANPGEQHSDYKPCGHKVDFGPRCERGGSTLGRGQLALPLTGPHDIVQPKKNTHGPQKPHRTM